MGIHPKKHTKESFLKFLEKNNVNDYVIKKFIFLPETIIRSGDRFDLDINTTWYDTGETYYNFELNYYSEHLIEYLFDSKVFSDVEISIDLLISNLITKNYIKKSEFESL